MYCLKFSVADRLPSSSIGRASGSGPGGWWFESTLGNRSHLFVPAGPPAPWGFFYVVPWRPHGEVPRGARAGKEASRQGYSETNPRGRPGYGRAGEGEQRGMPPALKNRSEAVRRPYPTAGKIGASPEKFRRGVKHKREEKFSI